MASNKPKPKQDFFQKYREQIGDNIRVFREQKEYSQDELAEMMEVSRSTISKIENGRFAITIDYIMKFGWYLDFDIALLKKTISKNS